MKQLIPAQAPPSKLPSRFDLGKTNAEILLNSALANRNAAISLVRQGHHSVYLYTLDLDPKVLNDESFAKSILQMIKNYKHMQVRILVRDSSKAVKGSHILLRLAQQLSTHIEVRQIPGIFNEEKGTFMVVDRAGFYYRPKAIELEGTVNFNSPARAVKLLDFFSDVWEKSSPDPHFRKLHI